MTITTNSATSSLREAFWSRIQLSQEIPSSLTNAAAWIPGGNPEQMYYNLMQKLMALPHDMILFRVTITHAQAHATLGEQKKTKAYLEFPSFKQFPAATGYR